MANTYGIPASHRRAYSRSIPGESVTSLPPISSRNPNGKKGSKTSEIIEAVNKEKWTFLQRLLAIEEKHEQKKIARQKEVTSKEKEPGRVNQENHPDAAGTGRWMSAQILDDNNEDNAAFPDDELPGPSMDKSKASVTDKSIFTTSLPSISQQGQSHSNSNYPDSPVPHFRRESFVSSPSSHTTTVLHKEESFMSRLRRKRPLRLPPILLPPVYTVRPRPLQEREFLKPTKIRGPITDAEWEDLHNCRYIRHVTPKKYTLQVTPSQSSFYYL